MSEKTCIDVKDLQKKIYILNQEISSKLDTIIMNQCRLNYYLLPNEKIIIRPTDFPSLPLMTEEDVEKFEKYLSENDNITATVRMLFFLHA